MPCSLALFLTMDAADQTVMEEVRINLMIKVHQHPHREVDLLQEVQPLLSFPNDEADVPLPFEFLGEPGSGMT